MPEFFEMKPDEYDGAVFNARLADAVMKHSGHMITVAGAGGDLEMFAVYCAKCDDVNWWGGAVHGTVTTPSPEELAQSRRDALDALKATLEQHS